MKQKYKYNKRENLDLWRRTRWELSSQLVRLREQNQLTIPEINQITHIPGHIIDNMETGRKELYFQFLMPLAFFYGKRIKILLVDPSPEDLLPLPDFPHSYFDNGR